MKYYLFGMDSRDPQGCARMLRERGIEAVCSGDFMPEAAAALSAEGIGMYLCYGAYSTDKENAVLAQDPSGQPRRWFNSGCPCDVENATRHLDAVLARAAALPQVRGILADGARFASFASVEGVESFFTCFCPRCMQRMTDMGLDARAIRSAVDRLMKTRNPAEADAPLVRGWLRFREKIVQEYMDAFAARVHALRSDLLAGAFIFAPSLGLFVGQTMQACRSLDVVAHMLYRDYHQTYGVACLGHEWAALTGGFGQNTGSFLRTCDPDYAFQVEKTPDELLQSGFAPEWVASEIAHAHRQRSPGQQLWPILQLDDDQALTTTRLALQSGADAAGFFAYGHAEIPHFDA